MDSTAPLLSKEDRMSAEDPKSSKLEDAERVSSQKSVSTGQVEGIPLCSPFIDKFATLVADDRIKHAENILLKAAGVYVLVWICLVLLFVYTCPEDSFERARGVEQAAYSMVFSVLLVTNISTLMNTLFKDDGSPLSFKSGFVLASYSAQMISTITGGLIAFFPTPVLMDPLTGQRVHMLRWAAWAPLAGLMTFLVEGIDMTLRENGVKRACIHSFILFIRTIPGAIFPYVPNAATWYFLFIFGVLCLGDIYYRYFSRRKHYQDVNNVGSAEQILQYHQTKLGYRLLRTCLVMWSLVGVHLVTLAVVPFTLPEDHILRSPGFPAILECAVEIISKVWYLMVITKAYELIFDENARTTRRLEELRVMMLAVWNKSVSVTTCK